MDLGRLTARTPRQVRNAEREAAVLVPVVERPAPSGSDLHLLFTKRADHLGEHPGQMSFPGGGREPEDADLTETALREANEEVGLEPTEADVLGALDGITTVSEYAITPVVARVPDREYVPDEREVAEIAVLPVSGLLDPENYEYEHREHPTYGEIVVHYFRVNGYTVWGATGRMVVQLLELTTDWCAPERLDPEAYG
jgi:8-oxo-dGTP pyrophosphatase MutT (NUDIX family)